MGPIRRRFALIALAAAFAGERGAAAALVPVRYPEGLVHGFLELRAEDGKVLADGDLYQTAKGDVVTSRLVYRFRDGSVQDETAVFRQGSVFRLVEDRLVQQGPSFPRPTEVTVHAATGRVIVRTRDKDGRERTIDRTMTLPPDVANGIVLTLIKNLPRGGSAALPMVAAAPDPLLVTLRVSPEGEEEFLAGTSRRKATRYVVRIDIGGVKGALAKLLGKNPHPVRVWVLGGDAPTFLKSVGPLYLGGPDWRLQLSSPEWPAQAGGAR